MIGIVAPSSPIESLDVEDIREEIEKHGYKVKIGDSCYEKYRGYLAGKDKIRRDDLERFFRDDEIDIIIALRGGYGASRILKDLDYELIKKNKKIFVGFSDITALHIALNKKCNLKTYHGLMASNSSLWDEFSYKSFIDAIKFIEKDEDLILMNPKSEKIYTLYGGIAKGEIIGGNLSLIISTLSTEFEIDTKRKILFIEEVNEPLYKLDRMLTQLKLSGKLSDASAIIFGDFRDCTNDEQELVNLLKEFADELKKPCIYNLQSGHCMPMITIPFGRNSILYADKKLIKILK